MNKTQSRNRLIMLGASAAVMSYFWLKKKAQDFVDQPGQASNTAPPSDIHSAAAEDIQPPPPAPSSGAEPMAQTLFEFLSGNIWLDARQWRDLWAEQPELELRDWLLDEGAAILNDVRRSLITQPALLSGCRRRWLVVCRHANMEETEALEAWKA